MTNNKIQIGDLIKCRDKEDAGGVAETLSNLGYIWDYVFEHDGQKGIWIEIQGRYVENPQTISDIRRQQDK